VRREWDWKKSICAPGDWSVARDGRIRRALPTRPGQEIIWFALVYQEKVCEQVQNHCRFNRARALASENLSHTFSRLSLALVEFPVSSATGFGCGFCANLPRAFNLGRPLSPADKGATRCRNSGVLCKISPFIKLLQYSSEPRRTFEGLKYEIK
jgi:hypothetical protein